MRRVLILADELMVRTRIEAAASPSISLTFARDRADFAAQLDPPPDLILVGMTATRLPWAELVRGVRATPASATVPIVAFGPHRNLELRSQALSAGVDRVMANSALMIALPGLLQGELPEPEPYVVSE